MIKKINRIFSIFLTVILVFSMFTVTSYAKETKTEDLFRAMIKEDRNKRSLELKNNQTDKEDIVTLIITLNEKSAKDYSNLSLQDLSKDKSITSKVYASQEPYINKIRGIDPTASIENRYYLTSNGFSIKTKYKNIKKIEKINGVSDVSLSQVYYKNMASIGENIGVNKIHKDYGYTGKGKVVAVLDSGVDPYHKDMKLNKSNMKLNRENIENIKKAKKISYGKFFNEKVPFGYNYSDKNNDIVDKAVSNIDYGHGMHVAGIIGANCQSSKEIKENNGVRGIAPDSQILAMKIFSNNPDKKGALESDIIQAIEDSIALGADVINMSFCMTAGFQDPSEGQQLAINQAVNEGIIVVSAAGNAAYSTFPMVTDKAKDNGTIGSPGLARETIQVASLENSKMVTYVMEAKTNRQTINIPYVISDYSPEKLKGSYEIIDCGLGKKDELEDLDLTGKIGLVKRGEIEFKDKKLNIQKKGAIAVIIYNRDGEQDFLPNISTDEKVKIPTVFTDNKSGVKLIENINNTRISFTKNTMAVDNFNRDEMSLFSSYGPTPNLDLKPDLTATGGNVWSTINDNKYKNMSGTSMASPLVSGLSSLMLEHIETLDLDLTSKKEKVDYVKMLLMNTADIKLNGDGEAYSPRIQGAGVVNIEKSLENKVMLSCDNLPSVILKEVKGDKTIKLKVKNNSDKSVRYKVKVLSSSFQSKIDGMEIYLDGMEEKEIETKIEIIAELDNYVEGFIKLKGENAVDINIPVLGFYGDWSNLPAIDSLNMDESVFKHTGLYTTENDGFIMKTFKLGGKNNKVDSYAINPEDKKAYNNVLPKFSLLRNAKELKIDITNSSGDVIKIIEDKNNVRKEVAWEQEIAAKVNFDWIWEGNVYDKELGIQKTIEEGQYNLNIRVKPDFEGAREQVLTIPIKIDKTLPKVKTKTYVTDGDIAVLDIYAKDEGAVSSGINTFLFLLNGKKYEENGEFIFELESNNDFYKKEITIDRQPLNTIDLGVTDHADNMISKKAFVISSKYSNIILNTDKNNYKIDEKISLEYSLDSSIVDSYEVSIDSLDNIIYRGKDSKISIDKPLSKGAHNIFVKALDKEGKLLDINFKSIKIDDSLDKSSLSAEYAMDKFSFKNGQVFEGAIRVENTGSEDRGVSLILCLYDQYNKLINTSSVEKRLKPNTISNLSTSIKVPLEGEYKIKVMTWDDLDSMNNIMPPLEINQI